MQELKLKMTFDLDKLELQFDFLVLTLQDLNSNYYLLIL